MNQTYWPICLAAIFCLMHSTGLADTQPSASKAYSSNAIPESPSGSEKTLSERLDYEPQEPEKSNAHPPAEEKRDEAPPSPAKTSTGSIWGDWLKAPGITGDWGGGRKTLHDHGVDLTGQFTFDSVKSFRGGLHTNNWAFIEQFFVNLDIDTEKLIRLPGGHFHMMFQTRNGPGASNSVVGDYQNVLGNDGGPDFYYVQIGTLWYAQELGVNLDGQKPLVRIKIGKDDGGDFNYSPYYADFLNSANGYGPTIIDQPTSPTEAMSVQAFVMPYDWLYAGFALFDGAAQEGYRVGKRGPSTFFKAHPSDWFMISQAGVKWEKLFGSYGRGQFGAGVWHDTGRFQQYNGDETKGTTGPFLIVDQELYNEHPDDPNNKQGAGWYLQWGWADPKINAAEMHLGTGVRWQGAIPTRDDDVTGFAMNCVRFTDARQAGYTEDWEVNLEAFYKFQITEWLSLQPDVQYIVNPGGQGLNNAIVGLFRLEVNF